MSFLLLDLCLAVRRLRRAPASSLAAATMLAVSLAACSMLFQLLDEAVVRPAETLGSDELFVLWETSAERDHLLSEISYPNFLDWRAENRAFEDMAAMGSIDWTLSWRSGDSLRRVRSRAVTWSFFDVLRARPALGRTFVPEDDEPSAERVVVVSHGFWQAELGGDADVLGRTLPFDASGDERYTVIGVMPSGFHFPRGTELWTPLGRELAAIRARTGFDALGNRGLGVLFAVGRLHDGVSRERAESDLSRVVRRLARDEHRRSEWARWGAVLMPFEEFDVGSFGMGLRVLLGGSLAVLFLSSLNVGGLLLARSVARRRELAVRAALGGGLLLAARDAAVESLLLVLASAGPALAITRAAAPFAFSGASFLAPRDAGTDARALLVLGILSIAAAALVALPSVASARTSWSLARALSERSPLRAFRKPLLVAETAIAMVLVAAALLLGRSYVELSRVDLGFRPEGVLSFEVDPPEGTTLGQKQHFYTELLERIESLDGVRAAAAVRNRPLQHGAIGDDWPFLYEGQADGERERNPTVNVVVVSKDYFLVMGIGLLSGRSFDEKDMETGPPVVIVGESLALYAWPDAIALGKRISFGGRDERGELLWHTVVGVVTDTRYRGLTARRSDVYLPYGQTDSPPGGLVVLADSDPYALTFAIRERIRSLDRNASIGRVTSMEDVISEALSPSRWNMVVSTLSAVFALGLASLGLFASVAQTAAERTREIGIRAAVGAGPRDVWRLLTGEGFVLVLSGVVLGAAVGRVASKLLAGLLYGVDARDAASLLLSGSVLLAVGMLACHFPARRAARLSPLEALRHD